MGFGDAGCWLLCDCHGFWCLGGFWVLGVGFGIGKRGGRGLGLLGKGGRKGLWWKTGAA